jgi:hypothetical protein
VLIVWDRPDTVTRVGALSQSLGSVQISAAHLIIMLFLTQDCGLCFPLQMSATKDKQGAQAAMHSLKGIAANNGKLMLQLAKIEDVNKVKAQVATWERGVKAIGA